MTTCGPAQSPNLEDLTVILLTRNREELALAAVRQWSGLAKKVVVADGSDRPSMEFGRIPGVVHFVSDEGVERRLQRAVTHVETAFAMLQSDDDVFVPSVVQECISFLKANVDYVAVTPNTVQRRDGLFRITYPTKSLRWNNANGSTLDRLLYLGTRYVPSSIYGVCRTEALRISFSSMGEDPIPVYAFAELYHEFVINALGKVRILSTVGWIRRDVRDSVETQDNFTDALWYERRRDQRRIEFVERVARVISSNQRESLEDAKAWVDKALCAYAHSVAPGNKTPDRSPSRRRAKDVYKRLVPRKLRAVLKQARSRNASYEEQWDIWVPWEDLAKNLSRNGILLTTGAFAVLQERELLETGGPQDRT